MTVIKEAKALRALDLRALLAGMPYHWHAQPNNVGSLSVFDRHPSEPGARLIGYVDFEDGVFQALG